MTSVTVFGCTGAVGSKILTTLIASDVATSISTISRRRPNVNSPKLEAYHEPDSSRWSDMISALEPNPHAVFNAIGTTKKIAGSVANQWKIDHDLCIEIAKAAKAAGVGTYIFISSFGT